jgi:hypothetical protein
VSKNKAIIGDLSAEMSDGTVLTASNDLRLAWLVAEHGYGRLWERMSRREQYIEVADALDSLRAAYSIVETEEDDNEEEENEA